MPKCEQCGAELQEAELDGPLCAFCQLDADDAKRLQEEADSHFTAAEDPLALEDVENATVMFETEEDGETPISLGGDSDSSQIETPEDAPPRPITEIELELTDGDDDNQRPTLHGAPTGEKPMTEGGAASLTRFDQVTPAPPSDSGAAATIELERKIEKMWAGVESESSSPSATLRVSASHLEDDTHLSVSQRPIAYPEAGPGDKADYRVMGFIAQGGMGRVYKAQQTSLGRQVAIKTLKDDLSKKDRHRRKFFAEASITGRLDHPNIVPIYDLGVRADGVPFYSMKFVTGEPWDACIEAKSKTENVNILLRVCDAMAFAHSKQILHRDLKPENVMLGEYGEVLVADWGLAIHMQRDREFSLGGTPLYMSPEMANHDVPLIGVRSDVYLLGAILFEILEGKAPHSSSGKTATERLLVAAMNRLEPHESTDELIEVALKALSTNPSDRYDSVKDFQEAIIECQRHADSRDRAQRAATELKEAKQTGETEKYARAQFAFQDAIDLWPENHVAVEGLQATRIAYAENALKQRDYGLGLSLLDESDPEHQSVHKKLIEAQKEEEGRSKRLKLARRVAMGATAATVLSLIGFGVYANNAAKVQNDLNADLTATNNQLDQSIKVVEQKSTQLTTANKKLGETNNELGETNKKLAKTVRDLDDKNIQLASTIDDLNTANENLETQTNIANTNAEKAKQEEQKAHRRAFAAKVALTAADLAVYDTENAAKDLDDLTNQYGDLLDWEADRLRYLTHADFANRPLGGQALAVGYSADGQRYASLVRAGSTTKLVTGAYDESQEGEAGFPIEDTVSLEIQSPRCVAFGPQGEIAVGGGGEKGDPLIEIWRPGKSTSEKITSPDSSWEISAFAFSPDGRELAVAHHAPSKVQIQTIDLTQPKLELDPMVDSAAEYRLLGVGVFTALAYSADGQQLAAVERSSGDGETRIRSWTRTNDGEMTPNGSFAVPALSLAFDPKDPLSLAVGCDGGALLLCEINPSGMSSGDSPGRTENELDPNRIGGRVIDQFDRHTDDITHVAFSPTGDRLATASRSGTALVWTRAGDSWAIDERPPVRHNSPLMSCVWAEGGESLLTSSVNGKLSAWPLNDYQDVRRFAPHGNPDCTTINTTPDETRVVVGAHNGHTWLYNANAPQQSPLGDYYVGHAGKNVQRVWSHGDGEGDVLSLSFDPPSASTDSNATVVDWSQLRRHTYNNLESIAIDLCSSGDSFALFDLSGVSLVNRQSGKVVGEDNLSAKSLACLPTGDRVVVGDGRGRLYVLEMQANQLQRISNEALAPGANLTQLAATRWQDTDVVYAASDEAIPAVYRVTIDPTGQLTESSALEPIERDRARAKAIRQLACDGPWVAAIVGVDNELYVLEAGQSNWTRLASNIQSVAIDRSGAVVAVTSDGRLRLGNAAGDGQLGEPREGGEAFAFVGRLANGSFHATGRNQGRPVTKVWRPGAESIEGTTLESRSPIVLAWPIQSATGGSQVVTLSEEGAHRVWSGTDAETPVRNAVATPAGYRILQATSSPDHALIGVIATNGEAVIARVLDASQGDGAMSEWKTLPFPAGETPTQLTTCAVANDLFVAWDAGTQTRYDWRLGPAPGPANTWRNETRADVNVSTPQPVAVSQEGKIALLSTDGSQGGSLCVFDNESGAWKQTHRQSPASAISLAFTKSGARVLTGTATGQVVVYDVSADAPSPNGAPLPIEKLTAFNAHRRPVQSLGFSPSGETLLTAANQGEAFYWPAKQQPKSSSGAGGIE